MFLFTQPCCSLLLLSTTLLFSSSTAQREILTTTVSESRKADIYLGGLFPVHKSGDDNRCGKILDLGVQRMEAMIFAVEKINNDSTLLPGLRLGYEIRDTCTQENRALEESLTYIIAALRPVQGNDNASHPVAGVVGAASSGISIAVAKLLRLFHVPQISYGSTAKFLSDKTRFDYFFRTVPPDLFQAQVMTDLIVMYNWTQVIAINSEDTYGREGVRGLIETLEATNINSSTIRCISVQIEISPNGASEDDFDAAIDKIEKPWVRNASVIVIFGQLSVARGIMQAVMRRKEVDKGFANRSLTFIGSDAWGDQLEAQYREVAHGMLSVLPVYNESVEFNKYMEKKKPVIDTQDWWFPEYWESVFNCSLTNWTDDREMCNLDVQKLTPAVGFRQNSKVPFSIDAVYAFAHAIHNLLMDVCGEISLCDNAMSHPGVSSTIKGSLLLEYLRNVTFTGVSGVIKFDSNGDQRGSYCVKNLQHVNTSDGIGKELKYVKVGLWDMLTEKLDIYNEVEWNSEKVPESVCSRPCRGGLYPAPVDGQLACCWVCHPCPRAREVSDGRQCTLCEQGYSPNTNKTKCVENPQLYLSWLNPFTVIMLLLTMVGLGVTTFVGIIFSVRRKHPIVKASSRELSAVLLVGIFLCFLLPFTGVGKPNIYTCTIHRFGFGFSFSLCYSALLIKTNRIFRIFSRAGESIQKPALIHPKSQLFFTSMLVLVQVVISVVWLVVERPGVTYIYGDKITEVTCAASPYSSVIVPLGFNFVLLIASTVFAFLSRKIPQNFNETRFICMTLVTILITWTGFIPTYFGSGQAAQGSLYRMGSQVFAIIISATITLVFLFFPKLYYMFSAYRKERE